MDCLDKYIELLENTNFFGDIERERLTEIARCTEIKAFQSGVEILTENEPVDGVYVVEKGNVNVAINRQVVRINIPPGQMYGEMSCLSSTDIPASATVIAVTDVTALFIPRKKVKELANRFPIIWERAWEKMAQRLSYTNKRFSELLDHTQLIRLDQNGVITGEMSAGCAEIVGMEQSDLENSKFAEIMFRFHDNPEDKSDWESIYPMLFEGVSVQAVVELLPKTVRYMRNGRELFLEFKYLPCRGRNNDIELVHVNIEDATVKRRLEMRTNALETEKKVRDKMYEEPDGYVRFLELAESTLTDLKNKDIMSASEKNDVLRNLHTVKGLSGLFMLNDLKDAVHALEDVLLGNGAEPSEGLFKSECLNEYENLLNRARAFFENMSPDLKRRLTGTVVSADIIERLKTSLEQGEIKATKDIVRKIGAIPVEKIAFGWEELVGRLAGQMEKWVEFRTDIEEGLVVTAKTNEILSAAMIHLVRNAVSHGIETAEEREAAGKAGEGFIEFIARTDDKSLILGIRDDGRGLDEAVILEKALKKADAGKIDRDMVQKYIDEGKIVDLIFVPGFSTMETADDVSGRGVGMDAVYEAVEKLRGNIGIKSVKGEGTSFIIQIDEDLN